MKSSNDFDIALGFFPNSAEPQFQALVIDRDKAVAAFSESLETIKTFKERIDVEIHARIVMEVTIMTVFVCFLDEFYFEFCEV